MKERPILFSGPMVRAILAGEKTQTRRLVSTRACGKTIRPRAGHVQALRDGSWEWSADGGFDQGVLTLCCPHGGPGDRLWVRETWRAEELRDGLDGIRFRADQGFQPIQNSHAAADLWMEAHANGNHGESWRPSIFLRRWASRITLEISSVRAEQLQAITDDDIRAEGVTLEVARELAPRASITTLREAWAAGWDAINGDRAAWASNPWVWVLAFARVGA